MGTPDFAAVSLKELLKCGYNIKAVFTPKDKPKGRGYKLEAPPVKQLALQYELPVFQPQNLKCSESVELIKSFDPDVIVVIAYGVILPKEILDIPKYGCINVHASLLPKYRGAGPIQWSIINGEKYAGVTTMFMDEGIDTGDIILKNELLIEPNETAGELMSRLAVLGSKTLLETLGMLSNNTVVRVPQNNSQATLAPILKKSLAFINFNKPALEVHNLIRGINPWPVAKVNLNGKMLKVYKSKVIEKDFIKGIPGTIIDNEEFVVACLKGSIALLEVQLEGGKKMLAKDFLRGHKVKVGEIITCCC